MFPLAQVGRCGIQTEVFAHLSVHSLVRICKRHGINAGGVESGNDVFFLDVTEQGDFAFFILRNRHLRTAKKHIRLNTVFLKLLYGVLGGFGFQLARSRNKRQQGNVNEHNAFTAEVIRRLANGFQKGLAFNIADSTADFAQDKVLIGDV